MCAYLAPRWRRRLLVALTLVLLTVNASSDRESSDNTSPTSVLGVVSTNSMQNTTALTNRAWNISMDSSDRPQEGDQDDNELDDNRVVSFGDLVKTTPAPPTPQPGRTRTKDEEDNKPSDAPTSPTSDRQTKSNSYVPSEDASAATTTPTPSSNNNKTPSPKPETTPFTPPTSPSLPSPARKTIPKASEVHTDLPRTGGLVIKEAPSSSSSLNEQNIPDQLYQKANTAEALHEPSKSTLTTSKNSLGQTLVVVIIGIVGSIAVLVLLVSRKVLQETDDYAEDSDFSSS